MDDGFIALAAATVWRIKTRLPRHVWEDGGDGLGFPASGPMPRTMPMSAQRNRVWIRYVIPDYTAKQPT